MTEVLLRSEKIQRVSLAARKLKEKLEAKAYEGHLIDFTGYMWSVCEPAIPFIRGWAIDAIADHLEAVTHGHIRRLLINVPPGFSKSMLTDVFWPAWEWGPQGKPWYRYVCAAYSNHLTERDNMRCRNVVMSEKYQRLWGDKFQISNEQFTKVKFANNQTGWKLATSTGGIGVGERGDRFICFPGDEVVHTEAGPRKIADLVESRRATSVLSLDIKTGKSVYRPIIGWHKNPASRLVRIGLSDGTFIRCTPDHRFWIRGKWVRARNISEGEPLTVVSDPNVSCDASPSLAGSDHGDCVLGYPISGSQNFGGLSPVGGYLSGLLSSQNCPGPIFQERESSMSFGVVNVLGSGVVFQIIRSIILRISVVMANIKARWSWAYEGSCNQDMCLEMVRTTVSPQIKTQVSFAASKGLSNRLSKNLTFCHVRALGLDNHAWHATHTAMAGGLVSRKTGNREPNLFVTSIDDGGHAPSTYCLTVEDTHTFCVGVNRICVANCDDPNQTMLMESEAVRYTTNMWFTEVVPDRLNSPEHSAIVVIQQRLHEEDVSGVALSRDMGYTHLCIPMCYEPHGFVSGYDIEGNIKTFDTWDPDPEEKPTKIFWQDPRTEQGELAWPERFPQHVCDELRSAKGEYAWAGQYQQSPTIRGGSIIKYDYWQEWESPKYPENIEYILASVDTAYTEKQENDASAMTVWGMFRDINGNPKIMLMYAWQDRLQIHDLVEKIIKTCGASAKIQEGGVFQVDKLLIEAKASGLSVSQEIRRIIGFNGKFGIDLINPTKQGDKVARAHSILHLFTDGMIYAPPTSRAWVSDVVNQCATFPRGSHDDLVDSATMALRYLRDHGFALRREEIKFDEEEELRYKPKSRAIYPC